MSARGCGVTLDTVGLVNRAQGVAFVACLAAADLSRLAARTLEHARRLVQAVARWRLAAVGAVLIQPALKLSDVLLQSCIVLAQGCVFLTKGGIF